MKIQPTLHLSNFKHLFFSLFILFSFQSFADAACGQIEGFEFTNGNEKVAVNDGDAYAIDRLPGHFYVNALVSGRAGSVKYVVENLDTGKYYSIIENTPPFTFPAGNGDWNLGKGRFKVTAALYKYNFGFGKCDTKTITFTIGDVNCSANAGGLTADSGTVVLSNGTATISATPDGNIVIPEGYSSIYVLTSGENLVIEQVGATPSFTVEGSGLYTIHTLVYDGNENSANYLNLGVVELGETTGGAVLGIVTSNGLCAALDVSGAPIMVEECSANAGGLTADSDTVVLSNGTATISATPDGNIVIPEGYSSIYVLTSGENLVIEQVNAESPEFTVEMSGLYTIHTLVYDGDENSANYLNLGVVELGETTGGAVLGIVTSNGLCAALDVSGAPIMVEEDETVCNTFSGKMFSESPINCLSNGSTIIYAETKDAPVIPDGYQQLYVLTEAFSLTILNVSSTPEFEVTNRGFYRIHSLVYNPNTLDLSVVVPGQTTGFDVAKIIAENDICASLDVEGAINLVIDSRWFCYFFNKYFKNGKSGKSINSKNGFDGVDLASLVNNYDSYEAFKEGYIDTYAKVKFFPNPIVNQLKVAIEVFDNEVMEFSIIDVSGRRVISGSAKDLEYGIQTINTSRLNAGMYLVRFTSEYRTITEKIIVKK